ncbi:hypothetical protein [Enterococcus sp. AZ196]|uniref:hypothetical protein n=1 Tax=Enterococcus sp. AZ196 TaxID=2774659 RepID=UPI003D269046
MFNIFYQLTYDKSLNADVFFIEESKEWVIGASIALKFSPVFDDEEIVNNHYEQTIQLKNTRSDLPNLVKVSYDNKSKSFSFSEHPEIKGKYEIVGYTKDIIRDRESTLAEPTNISKQEFDFIIETYGHNFHSDSNLQTLSYSRDEISNLEEGIIVENKRVKHSNSLIDNLESKLAFEKDNHEKILSTRCNVISMKEEYRKQCLQFMNEIDYLTDQKEFFLNYETYEQESILNSYEHLINEWRNFTKFIGKKEIYNQK